MLSAQCYCSNGFRECQAFLHCESNLGEMFVREFHRIVCLQIMSGRREGTSQDVMNRRKSAKECDLSYPKYSDDILRYALLLIIIIIIIIVHHFS
jgi:hypothetical protein